MATMRLPPAISAASCQRTAETLVAADFGIMFSINSDDTIRNFMATSETSLRTSPVPDVVNDRPTVSIVIPAYNEAARIGDSIRKVNEYVTQSPLSIEVIVVDDGSIDSTRDIVRANPHDSLRLIRNAENHGKGYSVRQGVANATGTWVLFTDADLSAPIEELQKLFDVATREDADIVIG